MKSHNLDATKLIVKSLLFDNCYMSNYLSGGNKLFNPADATSSPSFFNMWKDSPHGKEKHLIIGIQEE